MNVLSLFDGMSCGQIALNKAGVKYDKYFASEIKPHAIKVTQHNYPNTIQVGDVTKIKASDLPQIDLLVGGSPCQDFSSANKQKLGLEGEKSGLFYEYLRLLKELNPKYFLLENVAMDDFSYSTISHLLGTFPSDINSSLVSAQLRQRSYWTNIGGGYEDLFGMRYSTIPQPKDLKISFQSILENGFTDRLKARCILESESRPLASKDKLYRRYSELGFINIVFDNQECIYNENIRILTQLELERLQTVPEGYTSLLKRNDAACLLGDGWTVDVIAHIFSYLDFPKQ
jgi:DNA (cytosine-5)-methyltransferase 3A